MKDDALDVERFELIRSVRSPRPESWAGLWGKELDEARYVFTPHFPHGLKGTQSYWRTEKEAMEFRALNQVAGSLMPIQHA